MAAAKEAGADAVKLQTYTAETLTLDVDRPEFHIHGGAWDGRSLFELYQEAHTPWEWHDALFKKGRDLDLTVLSSPFDPTALALLESLGSPAHKVASPEIIDIPLIEKMAATGKPLIISTGMASLGEIGDAVLAARQAGTGGIVLLHCVSGYPTPVGESNLRTIPNLGDAFGELVGLSDHSHGIAAAVAAVALGAVVIEKHFTLSRADGGPDAAFSLEPSELRDLVENCRAAWEALGAVSYARSESEKGSAAFRRSLYVVEEVAAGEVFTAQNVRSIRPANGLAPKNLPDVIGRRARHAIVRGTPLEWSHITSSG
jgi:N-acetylneuraminate synthase